MIGDPQTFQEFVGQDQIKREMVAMLAVGDTSSILLRGNYGSGKTTLGMLYASRRGDYTYRPVPKNLDDFNPIAATHVIDEIHLLTNQEVLYPLFDTHTFVFCTTEREELSTPFLSRCIEFQLDPYTDDDLYIIIEERANREQIDIDDHGMKILAARSRGTPRTAVQLLHRVSTFARASGINRITPRYTASILNELKIYDNGMTDDDLKYLNTLLDNEHPVSLFTMGAVLNRSRRYIQETIESFLLYRNLIMITSKGRVLTEKGRTYIDEVRRGYAIQT